MTADPRVLALLVALVVVVALADLFGAAGPA